ASVRYVCDLVNEPLTLVESMAELLEAVPACRPDLILLPALLPPHEEAALLAYLRSLADDERIETLITPVMRNREAQPAAKGWRWGRKKPVRTNPTAPADPRVFGERLSWTLQRVRETRQPIEYTMAPMPTQSLQLVAVTAAAPPPAADDPRLP